MLRNAEFEGSGHGEWTRDTHDGVEYGNWFTPNAWIGWWNPRQARPEAHVIPFEPPYVGPPPRVHEGHYACKLHKSFDDWTGGHYQIVEGLTPGSRYKTGFYAHAWCNHDGLPNAGDPNCAPMGCGPLYRLESELPPLNGDPVNDAWWAARFQVGVQFLAAGQNPDPSYNVLWGPAAAIYNAFAPVPTLEFEAEKPRVVIYLRAAFLWDYRNNDAYIDSAFLDAIAPQPAREYSRTYVLWPDSADAIEQQRIMALNPGRTCGPSADDAAIDHPFLTDATIISYKPQTWPGGKPGLEAFWLKYYGFPNEAMGDRIIYREDDAPPLPHPYLLWQRDPEWADTGFGDWNCYSTIGQQGCFITCLAMAQRFYDIQDDATPLSVDEALGPDGFNGCVANWAGNNSHFEAQLQISVSLGTMAQALEHINAGGCAMIEVEPASLEHFILAIEVEATNDGPLVRTLDPWDNKDGWMLATDAQSWRILTHVEPPVNDTTSRPSLHLQSMVPGVQNFLETARPGCIKRVTGMQDMITMKRWAPATASIYRHFGDQNGYLDRGSPDGAVTPSALRAARDWIGHFRDSLFSVCASGLWTPEDPLYIEEWNELGWAAGNLDSIQRNVSIDRAFVIELMALGLPVAPVTFCAGVGNIGRPGHEEEDFLMLVNLARETQAAGGAFGLHSYWTPGMLIENWKYLAGRYQWIDEVLVANGVYVKWMLGECGVAGVRDNPVPQSHDGWRKAAAYNADWSRYEADIIEFDRRLREWNATHGFRLLGAPLFTTGDMGSWPSFTIETPQINALAIALTT